MVTDKGDGPFDEADLRLLGSLAAPAALILEHFSRFEEAKATSEKMTELAQLKSDFVSVTSHELRTPLTSIIGSLATLARPELAPNDPGAQQLLATARRQADRLKRLIEDLLTASRLDNRSLPQRPQSIDLADFVRDAVRSIPAADEVVALDLSPDIPPLQADPDHVRRIVVNLVENALKYAPGSKVDVVARASGSEVWVSVIDHGPGVPYELHDHIFDRFTQVGEHATRVKGGTGLGLSIVRGLAEAMDGRVWYEPTVGGGATFSLALPLQRRSIA
jgi:two-component system sensor histidine kinase KdpD